MDPSGGGRRPGRRRGLLPVRVLAVEQAVERAGTKAGNKGFESAVTAIESVNLMKALK